MKYENGLLWFAILNEDGDNDWGTGAFKLSEACRMLVDRDWTDGKIAVIENDEECIVEISFGEAKEMLENGMYCVEIYGRLYDLN